MSIRDLAGKMTNKLAAFTERQGIAIVTTLCVAAITGAAVWQNHSFQAEDVPHPASGDVSAAQLVQQTLPGATPAPTPSIRAYHAPMADFSVLQEFNADLMLQSSGTGIWRIHAAVDLTSASATEVHAIDDGIVESCHKDMLLGWCVCVAHADGLTSLYARLQEPLSVSVGDNVRKGDIIGRIGSAPPGEADLPDHLHLEVRQDGHLINPLVLFTVP